MGSDQHVDPAAVKRLNELEKQLRAAAKQRDQAAEKYDLLYQQVWHVFDEELGEASPARFVCADGYVLGRQVRRQAPTIDTGKLVGLVKQLLPGLKGKRLLGRVLVLEPRVDQAKLAREIALGRLDGGAVQRLVTAKPPVLAKYPLREASQQEQQSLKYGVIESPSEEEWAG